MGFEARDALRLDSMGVVAEHVGPIRELDDSIVFMTRNDDEVLEPVSLATATGRAQWKRSLETKTERSASVTLERRARGSWPAATARVSPVGLVGCHRF